MASQIQCPNCRAYTVTDETTFLGFLGWMSAFTIIGFPIFLIYIFYKSGSPRPGDTVRCTTCAYVFTYAPVSAPLHKGASARSSVERKGVPLLAKALIIVVLASLALGSLIVFGPALGGKSSAVVAAPSITQTPQTLAQRNIVPTPTTGRQPALVPTATLMASSTVTDKTVRVANTDGVGVYIRRTPTLGDRIKAYPDRTELRVIGPDVNAENVLWVHVSADDGVEGYVPAQYLEQAN